MKTFGKILFLTCMIFSIYLIFNNNYERATFFLCLAIINQNSVNANQS